MKAFILISFLVLFLGFTAISQTNTFPPDGNAGMGTTSPQVWFAGKVFELRAPRPVLRLSPSGEGGLGTIVFKGGYDETPGTNDEFHLNYAASRASPSISLGGYMYGGDIFTILGNGNIGIGTTTPKAKLTVAGIIHSREVKVSIDAGADYVFKQDYDLQPLSEVESYVKANQHLPDIASAAEMRKDGLDLGEMNIKLLKKIEELTLYLIEKDTQLKDQPQWNKHQEERIAALENALSAYVKEGK